MHKFKCIVCESVPEKGWYYMPEVGDGIDYFYCDDCVPRGCSCGSELKEGIDIDSEEAKDPKNYFQLKDEKGREYPCCEYFWLDNKHEEEQRMSNETMDNQPLSPSLPFEDGYFLSKMGIFKKYFILFYHLFFLRLSFAHNGCIFL